MFDLFRAACCVPETEVADVPKNTQRICRQIEQCQKEKADAAVFPELCLCGYTAADLFFQEPLLSAVYQGINEIAKASRRFRGIVAIGAPITIGGQLYNCGIVLFQGKIYGIVPKTFLPNYLEFYEKRWFSSASALSETEISASLFGLKQEPIPVGNDLIFQAGGFPFGIEICEDLWAPVAPSAFLAMNGAEMIFNLSASNELIAKREYRKNLVKQQSASLLCAYVYTSAGAGESTTDLVFSGHSIIAENGTVLAESEPPVTEKTLVFADLDLGKIRTDRKKQKTFQDAATYYPTKPFRKIEIPGFVPASDGKFLFPEKQPFVPAGEKVRRERCLQIFALQTAGLKKRLSATGCRPVVGVSGGLDSTLALLVSVQAMKEQNRPVSDVIGITMPGFGTTGRTYDNATKLMALLGVTAEEINISEACRLHYRDIGQNEAQHDLTYENAQARERTQILMDVAGRKNGLVVGTGDLSELTLGWCTYNADHMSMYGVNAGVPKTLIRWMIESLIKSRLFPESAEVLSDILQTPVSPELLPPEKDGSISQKTEQLVGPYILHDFFLYYLLRFGFSPAKILFLAEKAFAKEFSREEILHWLKNFCRRFFSQQFKRSCLPDSVKIGSISLSPRGDWRMPSDASAAVWLTELEALEQEQTPS